MKNDLEVAITLASQAGGYIQRATKTLQNKSFKESRHLLTSIRDKSEESLMNGLKKYKQNDDISSEWQDGLYTDTPSRKWVIEPLSAPLGLLYGENEDITAVMIALREDMYTKLSVLFFPGSERLFYAELCEGAFKNHQPIDLIKKQRLGLEEAQVDLQQLSLASHESDIFKKADFALRSEQGAGVTTRSIAHASAVAKLLEVDNRLCAIMHDDAPNSSTLSPWEKIPTNFLITEAGGTLMNERYKEPHLLTKDPFVSAISTDIARSIFHVIKRVEYDHSAHEFRIS